MSMTLSRYLVSGDKPTLVAGVSIVRRYVRVLVIGGACVYFGTDSGLSVLSGYRVAAGDEYLHDDDGELYAITQPGNSTPIEAKESAVAGVQRPTRLG